MPHPDKRNNAENSMVNIFFIAYLSLIYLSLNVLLRFLTCLLLTAFPAKAVEYGSMRIERKSVRFQQMMIQILDPLAVQVQYSAAGFTDTVKATFFCRVLCFGNVSVAGAFRFFNDITSQRAGFAEPSQQTVNGRRGDGLFFFLRKKFA